MQVLARFKQMVASLSLASLVALSGVSMAEESGAFLGIGAGVAGTQQKIHLSVATISASEKGNGRAPHISFVAGYKTFFTPEFGLRYYADIGYATQEAEGDSGEANTKTTMLNYGVNVDVLYNFQTGENDIGVFLGLGIGGVSYGGSELDDAKMLSQSNSVTKNFFDIALNAGVRALVASHHGIEVFAKVPFLIDTIIDDVAMTVDGASVTGDCAYKRQYILGLRYAYNF